MGSGRWPNSLFAAARTSSNRIADPAWVRLAEPPIAALAAGPGRASLRLICIRGRGHNSTWQGPSDESNPVYFGGHVWDAVQLVVKALREAGPGSAKIRDSIEQIQRLVGADAVFTCSAADHNGLAKDAFVMVEIVDAKWKLWP